MQLTWSTNTVSMKTKELSKEVKHKMAEKHNSGEAYKKISKTPIIPLSMVKSLRSGRHITYPDSTHIRLPIQTQHPGKQETGSGCDCPTMTLKELQGSMSEMVVSVHQSTISCSLSNACSYGQVARKRPSLKKTHLKSHMGFTKMYINDTAGM